jgi:tRNA pseudouridine38-40 synthase
MDAIIQNTNIFINSEPEEYTAFRYAVVIEYFGNAYAGSQKQPEQKTVQSEVEAALKILASRSIKVILSGRTDTGVHSRGQVAHFDLPYEVETKRFINSMNALLPPDISIKSLSQVENSFHSQKSAMYRWYRYVIDNNVQRSVWTGRTSAHIQESLDEEAMNKALCFLIGKHDFTSFKKTNSKNPARECLMYVAECSNHAGMIYIDLVANRFLYNMVRIIVGTLIKIGNGTYPPEHLLEVLESQDRKNAGPTASAEGLTLMKVGYSKKYNLYENKEASENENLFCKAS